MTVRWGELLGTAVGVAVTVKALDMINSIEPKKRTKKQKQIYGW